MCPISFGFVVYNCFVFCGVLYCFRFLLICFFFCHLSSRVNNWSLLEGRTFIDLEQEPAYPLFVGTSMFFSLIPIEGGVHGVIMPHCMQLENRRSCFSVVIKEGLSEGQCFPDYSSLTLRSFPTHSSLGKLSCCQV